MSNRGISGGDAVLHRCGIGRVVVRCTNVNMSIASALEGTIHEPMTTDRRRESRNARPFCAGAGEATHDTRSTIKIEIES